MTIYRCAIEQPMAYIFWTDPPQSGKKQGNFGTYVDSCSYSYLCHPKWTHQFRCVLESPAKPLKTLLRVFALGKHNYSTAAAGKSGFPVILIIVVTETEGVQPIM